MIISIITPTTADRRVFLDRLQLLIEAQTVQPIEWLVDSNPGTIGAKRNRLNAMAQGDVIIPMDDDDIYLPDYIETALNALQESGARLVYSSKFPIHNVRTGDVYLLESGISEATMCYYRQGFPGFAPLQMGEGRRVLSQVPHAPYYNPHFMATVHGGNTCGHKTLALLKRVPQNEVPLILDKFYTTLRQPDRVE